MKTGINLGELTDQAQDLLKLTEIPASNLDEAVAYLDESKQDDQYQTSTEAVNNPVLGASSSNNRYPVLQVRSSQ